MDLEDCLLGHGGICAGPYSGKDWAGIIFAEINLKEIKQPRGYGKFLYPTCRGYVVIICRPHLSPQKIVNNISLRNALGWK